MSKGRLLAAWAAIAVVAYIFSSQDWYTLSMSPNGESVKLATYDGLTAYGNLSPVLMLNLAGVLTVSFVGSIGRRITSLLLALANLGSLVWMISRVATQDISGLAKQVEQMTGIAAAHGVDGLTVQTQSAPFGLLASLALLALIALAVVITEKRWPKRAARTEIAAKTTKAGEPKDAIGIWDSQRR
jgi:hypothetical protein